MSQWKAQLPDAYRGVDVDYTIFVSHKHRLIYVATAKAGCSTIKHTLMQAELERSDVRFSSMDDVHDRAIHPLSSPSRQYDFAANLADPSYLKFTFVRDPYSRFLSLYLDKLVRRSDGYFREQVARGLGRDNAHTPTFAEFTALVGEVGPDQFDAHTARLTTRTLFDVIRYDEIGRFESFESDLKGILALRRIDFARFYYAEQRHSASAGHKLAEFYDAASAARVRTLYASDFETFGYDPFPSWVRDLL